jgi:type II secretory pathway component PulF
MAAGIKPKQRAQFFRELAQLTAAGIPVTQAAKVLGQDWREASVREAVAEMERGLAGGKTIADALRPVLNGMEHGIVLAAERGGKLSAGFHHLEEYYQLMDQTRARVRGAAAYPLFMLHAAVLLPSLVTAVTGSGSVVLALLKGLLGIWAVVAVLWFAGKWLGGLAGEQGAVDRLLGWIPLIGPARRALALSRWHAVLHFNIASSQRISEGLREAGAATRSASLAAASTAAARQVDDGTELGPALLAQPAFPRDMAAALASAEFTGNLDTETLRWSRESVATATAVMETSTKRLCAVVYGLIVIFTGWQILRMAGGYVGAYSQALEDLG